MTESDARRAEFTVRCACGIAYHTSDAHLGHALPCKCGRTVVIARPANGGDQSNVRVRKRRKKRRFRATDSETRRAATLNSGFRRRRNVATVLLDPWQSGGVFERLVYATAWLYTVAMLASWMLLRYGSERTIPGTIIAYGPRWLALWPLALLVPLALIVSRTALLPLLLAAWIGLVPIVGARVSLSTLFAGDWPAKPAEGTFRVVTFNAQGGRRLVLDLPAMLQEVAPDIVLFQECGDLLWEKLQAQKTWYSAHYGSLCTGSRWPLDHIEEMPREEILRMPSGGGTGLVLRAFIDSPKGALVAINLHLETARRGLEGMLSPEGMLPDDPFDLATGRNDRGANPTESAARFAANVAVREKESALASDWARKTAAQVPVVIGGDFNLPVESTIFRRHWSAFVDAFESKGNGIGWTKREGRWLRIRIDHLLTTTSGPKPVGVMIGPDFGSDHRPVVADYAWTVRATPDSGR